MLLGRGELVEFEYDVLEALEALDELETLLEMIEETTEDVWAEKRKWQMAINLIIINYTRRVRLLTSIRWLF